MAGPVLRADAPAKVNLALAITGVRDDGYHLLRSVFLRLELHDELDVTATDAAGDDRLEVDGVLAPPDGDLAAPHDNLVLRAARQLRALVGADAAALHFRLRKRIPAAAGLGGGSSDAAAAMDLALAAWGVQLDPAERLRAALRLGADVPFFAAGHRASLVEGIGEQVAPLPAVDPPAGVLLVTPAARLATAAVFAELDRRPRSDAAAGRLVDEVADLLREGIGGPTLADVAGGWGDANDLWPPAGRLAPGLSATRERVSAILGRALLLSGSGPTLFALYPSGVAAARAAASLRAAPAGELAGATIISTTTARRPAT